MILSFFNTGTSSSVSLMKYLMGKDANGNERSVKPEVIWGNIKDTATYIDMNNNKHKYSSGVISFRDGEVPTDKQIKDIIKDLYLTFAPGMGPDRINLLAVLHKDKGNTEVHIVIPKLDLKTMKSFNISPPGQANQQLQRDFCSKWNHNLGYEQVLENPFISIFKGFNKFDASSGNYNLKKKFADHLVFDASSGKIRDRDDLIKILEKTGHEIKRRGSDYISVKFKGRDKPVRFKGHAYSEGVKYQDILNAPRETKLNLEQYGKLIKRIDSNVSYRREFNDKRYVETQKKFSKGCAVYKNIKIKPTISKNANVVIKEVKSSSDLNKSTTVKTLDNTNKKSPGSQNATSSSSPTNTSFGAVLGVENSLAGLQVSIDAAQADLAGAKTFSDRVRAESRLASLMAQRNNLLAQLQKAKVAELNSIGKRPKFRG